MILIVVTLFTVLCAAFVLVAYWGVRSSAGASWTRWSAFERWSLVLVWAIVPLYPTGAFITYRLECYEHARFLDIESVQADCSFKSIVWPLYVPLRLTTSDPWEQK